MKKYKYLLSIFLLIILCGFSSKPENIEPKPKTFPNFKIPAWLNEIPKNCIIGISKKSHFKTDMYESAKQMATIMECRNHASFTIDKSAFKNTENIVTTNKADFRLNVVANPENLKKTHEKIQLLDEFYFNDYFVGLYSTQNIKVSESTEHELFDWFSDNLIVLRDDNVYCYTVASSSNLISAWENASQTARLEIGKYLEVEIEASSENINYKIETNICVESTQITNNIRNTKSHILYQTSGILSSYTVYLETVYQIKQ